MNNKLDFLVPIGIIVGVAFMVCAFILVMFIVVQLSDDREHNQIREMERICTTYSNNEKYETCMKYFTQNNIKIIENDANLPVVIEETHSRESN